ncbi:hypothetical protein H2200_012793 [Cladophialophora chaetospira]|uniref:Uncharacterized protein n=1 Tax=Cladophialophora chaetospira TaxID=386627 RepID=A0AA39CBX3_9EURO|nr:hypothetical protein H2200_012793 [Cladophialophora chaetospira]
MEQSQTGMPPLASGSPTALRATTRIGRKPVPKAESQYVPAAAYEERTEGTYFYPVEDSSASYSRQCSTNPTTRMPGRLRHIALLCGLLVLPLCGVTRALLVIIYQNRLPPSHLGSSQPCSGLIADYGASQLTSLSTWISTVATLMAPAFMALLAYPVARYMTQPDHSSEKLPSPYQMGLLIELLGGGLMSAWLSMRYMISRKRIRLSPLLYLSSACLIFGIFLGLLTQLADFWLHRATESILHASSQAVASAGYGRQLSDYCQNYYATDGASQARCTGKTVNGTALNAPCSVVCGEHDFWPTGYDQGFLLANSLSANSSLAVATANEIDARTGNLVVLLPADVDTNITWTATTVGVSTHCDYLFDKCNAHNWPAGNPFTCGPEVPHIGYDSSGPIPFNSSGLSGYQLTTLKPSRSDAPNTNIFGNPWIFGLAMRISTVVSSAGLPDNLPVGDETVFTLLQCNTTTYDIEYSVGDQDRNTTSSMASDAITISKLKRSSKNVHNTIQGHILTADTNAANYIQKAMLTSTFSAEGSGHVLPRFEQEYGKVALSFAAPSFTNIPTIRRNVVDQTVVSCVQKAPLWSLVGLVCIYIILTLVLTIAAIVSSSGNNVRSAQSQLSVAGLAAKAFEDRRLQYQRRRVTCVEDLFEESVVARSKKDLEKNVDFECSAQRVGFRAAETGHWEYNIIGANEIQQSSGSR